MSDQQLQLNDIGAPIVLTVYRQSTGEVEDELASATNLTIYLKPPSGDLKTKTGSLYGDGTDGKVKYVTADGDLDEAGFWSVQAGFKLGVWTGRTSIRRFQVIANLS